ncbi:type IV secretory system conjugative DNA transfer family protein [Streptomyces noursei]|uniref:type IV secretory system conjugative DNA transfer family protein n=1 Tax=Streptomyces noursei TaxID=1971 RepID=UPI0023B86768|nr:type IV secretory system conjugative DNA transfer family protein [Streptomyces noursei]
MLSDSDRAWLLGTGALGSAVTLSASTWAGAAAGAALAGAEPAGLTPATVALMAQHWAEAWPHSPAASAAGAAISDLIVASTLAWGTRAALRNWSEPSGLATLRQLREMTPRQAARTATRLRASLKDRKPKELVAAERGVLLGNHGRSGVELRGSDEDTYVALMAPRSGKSTALAIPIAMEAPGALLLTSNKADVYAATRTSRAQAGTVHVFDTQGVAQTQRGMWWDMIAQAETIEGAERLAGHFVGQVSAEAASDPFWAQAAADVLVGYFRAAWHSGSTPRDVLSWLADPHERAPMRILHEHEPVLAEQVESSVNIAEETQTGIYQHARTAVSALRDEEVLAWVMPDKGRPEFRPEDFALGHDTLYCLSKRGGPASAVVAALVDSVFTAGMEAGERHGGRLPEPMRAVLDEVANICKIADLPDLYSHLGSRGITPLAILQSYRQGVKAWGEVGMDALWSAATKKLIGAGTDDPKFASDISTLVGRHWVEHVSKSVSKEGVSRSSSDQFDEIMEAAKIRAMAKGTALLLATGVRVASLDLRPWYRERHLAHLAPEMAAEEAAITKRAIGAYELRKARRRAR